MSEWAALSARLLILFSPLGIDWYLPALPSLVTAFGVQANLSMAAYLIPLGVGQLLFGPLGDRYGKRRVSLLGVLIFILASLAVYRADAGGVDCLSRDAGYRRECLLGLCDGLDS